jgi:hypothetical protein
VQQPGRRQAAAQEIGPFSPIRILILVEGESSMPGQSYRGPERRVHRLYVTRNTEYHFRGEVCVAVRDRRTRRWLDSHLAIQRKLAGGVKFHQNGVAIPSCAHPRVGEALYFDDQGMELITSMLSSIERPTRETVRDYDRPAPHPPG